MLKEIIPWKKKERTELSPFGAGGNSFIDLNRRMNQMFEDFWKDWDFPFGRSLSFSGKEEGLGLPQVDISENGKEILVTADLPGLDEKDLEVTLEGDQLIIQGEKTEEKEEKKSKVYYSERRSGKFQRIIPIPSNLIDQAKIKASLKKGVLKLTLPKLPGTEKEPKKVGVTVESC